MCKKMKGGMEGIIAAIILAGLVVAIVLTVVVPMSNEGDKLLDKSTGMLVDQQVNMRPKADSSSMSSGNDKNSGTSGIRGGVDAELTPVKPKLDTI